MPYALLNVESPLLPGECIMPVAHRIDFMNGWEIFEKRGVDAEEEVLVFYSPATGFLSAFKPKLHFYLHSKGHLEEIYDPDTSTDDYFRAPIAVWRPEDRRG